MDNSKFKYKVDLFVGEDLMGFLVNLVISAQISTVATVRSRHKIEEGLSAVLSHEGFACVTAYWQKELVGMLIGCSADLINKSSSDFYFSDLAVDPKYRNVGIATSLVIKLVLTTKELLYTGIYADAPKNSASYNILTREGFECVGTQSVQKFERLYTKFV